MWKLFKQLGLHAKALKIVVKQHEDKQNKETEKIVVEILKCMGWDHVVRWECAQLLISVNLKLLTEFWSLANQQDIQPTISYSRTRIISLINILISSEELLTLSIFLFMCLNKNKYNHLP